MAPEAANDDVTYNLSFLQIYAVVQNASRISFVQIRSRAVAHSNPADYILIFAHIGDARCK